MKRVIDAIRAKMPKSKPKGQDGEDGKAFASPGAYAEGGKGGKASYGQGGKGGDAIATGQNSIAIGGKGGAVHE